MAGECSIKEVDLARFAVFKQELQNSSETLEKLKSATSKEFQQSVSLIPLALQIDKKKRTSSTQNTDATSTWNADLKVQPDEINQEVIKKFPDQISKKSPEEARCEILGVFKNFDDQLLKFFPSLAKGVGVASVVDLSPFYQDPKNIDKEDGSKGTVLPDLENLQSISPSMTYDQFKKKPALFSQMRAEIQSLLLTDRAVFEVYKKTQLYVQRYNFEHLDSYNLSPEAPKNKKNEIRVDAKLDRAEVENIPLADRDSKTTFEFLESVRKSIPKLVISAYLVRRLVESKSPTDKVSALTDFSKKETFDVNFFAALYSISPSFFEKHPVLKELIPVLFKENRLRPELVSKKLVYEDFYNLAKKSGHNPKKLWDDSTTFQKQTLGEPYYKWPASAKGVIHSLDKSEKDYFQKLYVGEQQKEIATVVHYLEMAERTNLEYGECGYHLEKNCQEDDISRKKREIKYVSHETHTVRSLAYALVPPIRLPEYLFEKRLSEQHAALHHFKEFIHEHPLSRMGEICDTFKKLNPEDYHQLETELHLPYWRELAAIKDPEKFNEQRITLAKGFRDGSSIANQSIWRREVFPIKMNGKRQWLKVENPRLSEAMFVELQEESPEAVTIFTKSGLRQLLNQIDFTDPKMETERGENERFLASEPSPTEVEAYQKWKVEKEGEKIVKWEKYSDKKNQADQARQYYEQMRLGLIRGTFILSNISNLADPLKRFITPSFDLEQVYSRLGLYVAEIQLIEEADKKMKEMATENPKTAEQIQPDIDFLTRTRAKVIEGKLVDAQEINQKLKKYVPDFKSQEVRISLEAYLRLVDQLQVDYKTGTSGENSGEKLLTKIYGYAFEKRPDSLAKFLMLAFDTRIPTKNKIAEVEKLKFNLSTPKAADMADDIYRKLKGEAVKPNIGKSHLIDYLRYLQNNNLLPPKGELPLPKLTAYQALIKEGFPNLEDRKKVEQAIENPEPDDPVNPNKKPRTAFKELITSPDTSRLSKRNAELLLRIYDNMSKEVTALIAYIQWRDLTGRIPISTEAGAGVNADLADHNLDFQGSGTEHIFNILFFRVGAAAMFALPTLLGIGIPLAQGQPIPLPFVNRKFPIITNRFWSAIVLGAFGLALNISPWGKGCRDFGEQMIKKPMPYLSDYAASFLPEELTVMGIGLVTAWQLAPPLAVLMRGVTGTLSSRGRLFYHYSKDKVLRKPETAAFLEKEEVKGIKDIFNPFWKNSKLASLKTAAADGRKVWLSEEAELRVIQLQEEIKGRLAVIERERKKILDEAERLFINLKAEKELTERELVGAKNSGKTSAQIDFEVKQATSKLSGINQKITNLERDTAQKVKVALDSDEMKSMAGEIQKLEKEVEEISFVSTYSPHYAFSESTLEKWHQTIAELSQAELKLARAEGRLEGIIAGKESEGEVRVKISQLRESLDNETFYTALDRLRVTIPLEKAFGKLEGMPTQEFEKRELQKIVAEFPEKIKKSKEQLEATFPNAAKELHGLIGKEKMSIWGRLGLGYPIYGFIQSLLSPHKEVKDDLLTAKYLSEIWSSVTSNKNKLKPEELDLFKESLKEDAATIDEEEEEIE